MLRQARWALALFILAAGAGCATGDYVIDRAADALDVVTLSVGAGAGLKVRVGPVGTGILWNVEGAGLRGGQFYANFDKKNMEYTGMTFPLMILLWGSEASGNLGEESFGLGMRRVARRHKVCRKADGMGVAFPLVWFVEAENVYEKWHYYTQVEFAGGVGFTIRIGANAAELADFLLGWTTLDIMADDLAAQYALPAAATGAR